MASRGPVTPQTDLATTTLLLKHGASSFTPSSTSAVPSPALLSVFSNFSEQHLAPTFTQFRSALGDSKEDVKEVDKFVAEIRKARTHLLAALLKATSHASDADHSLLGVKLAEDLSLAVDSQSGGVDSALFSSYLDLAAKLFQAAPQSAALAGSAVKARTALVSIMRKYVPRAARSERAAEILAPLFSPHPAPPPGTPSRRRPRASWCARSRSWAAVSPASGASA